MKTILTAWLVICVLLVLVTGDLRALLPAGVSLAIILITKA
jgi:hypothetical protein